MPVAWRAATDDLTTGYVCDFAVTGPRSPASAPGSRWNNYDDHVGLIARRWQACKMVLARRRAGCGATGWA